jgi:hypothetical protein
MTTFQLRCKLAKVWCLIFGHDWKEQHDYEQTQDFRTMQYIHRDIHWKLCKWCFDQKDLDIGDWRPLKSFRNI